MFGFVDFGEGSDGIHKQQKSSNALQLATTVLQWVFLGLNGFRFPFCYMLNKGLTAGQICTMFWNIIRTFQTYDFKIIFISMDGASSNRSFFNMICNSATYLAKNISSLDSYIACIMDYSQVIKKIRNSLYASGTAHHHKRKITHKLGNVFWDHFKDAYTWDCSNHYLRIHRRLTPEHFELNSSLKMRNHLAEQTLNSDMLILLQAYQESLEDPSEINVTIDVVQQTSRLVDIFRSHVAVTSNKDPRLKELASVLAYFEDWHDFCKGEKKTRIKRWNISHNWMF